MAAENRGPLSGVRVLEFSLIYSAPLAGVQLADFGAEVIKVEQPPGGEDWRYVNTTVPGNPKHFQALNRGKQSLIIDLQSEAGRQVIYRLMPNIDAVIINFRPGVAERLGVGYEALREHRADLIYGEISGFGEEGPMSHLSASDIVAQAYGGTVVQAGKVDAEGGPMWPPMAVGDGTAGMNLAMGVLAALYHRANTGEGQYLHVSLLRSVMAFIGGTVMVEPVADASGRDLLMQQLDEVKAANGGYGKLIETRTAVGGGGAGVYFSAYSAKDGGVVIGGLTPRNRDGLRKILGIEGDRSDELGYDPSDDANKAKMEGYREQVRETFMTGTVDEWVAQFDEERVPAGRINFPEYLPDDPQGTLHMTDLVHPVTGPQRQVKPVVEMKGSPTAARPAAMPGEHTARVLREVGGCSEEEIAALLEQGVVVSDPSLPVPAG